MFTVVFKQVTFTKPNQSLTEPKAVLALPVPPREQSGLMSRSTVSTALPAGKVKVYLNDNLVTSWNPRYVVKSYGGVLVANGYKNVAYFRNFRMF